MKRIFRIIVVLLFIGIAVAAGSFICTNLEHQTRDIIVLYDKWNITVNDEVIGKQPTRELSDYSFPAIEKGDIIVLSRELSDVPMEQARIIMDVWHAVVNVYLDEELIYSCGEEYLSQGKMLGSIRHYVDLPLNYQEKTLYIEMLCTEVDAMSGMLPVGIAKQSDASVYLFNKLFPLLLPAMMLVGVGIFAMFMGILLFHRNNNMFKVSLLGVLLFLVGTYSLCRGKFVELLLPMPQVYNAIEFACLYFLPTPLIYLFAEDREKIKNMLVRRLYEAVLIVCPAFAIITSILHVTNKVHYSAVLTNFFVLILATIVIEIAVILNLTNKNRKVLKLYLGAVFMMLMGALMSIFLFNLRYVAYWNEKLHVWKWQEYIFLIFIFLAGVFAVLAFTLETKRVIYDSFYSAMYKKIAYTDALTELGNRRAFDEELEWLEENRESICYGVICFDVNDLKLFNDTKGHETGDKLIKGFAGILRAVSGDEAVAYRIGGDEFVVLIRDTRKLSCKTYAADIEAAIRTANRNNKEIVISAAYGYAVQGEKENVHKVYMLADNRMYEKKAEMKAEA